MTIGRAAPDSDISPPRQALRFLRLSAFQTGADWDRAHAICQSAEGTRAYDLVHALAHWIEGDMANRDYWYAQADRAWRRAATIEQEWQALDQALS